MISKTELKRIRSLRQKKYRRQYRRFLVEGVRLVEEALSADADVVAVAHTNELLQSERGAKLIHGIDKHGIPRHEVTEHDLKSISDTVHSQGIIAVASISEPSPIEEAANDTWLYLDSVSDPGNLGTMLRTADWFGLKYVALSPTCADPYNPKVVRSGMGAHFHLNICSSAELSQFKQSGHTLLAANQKGIPLNQLPLTDDQLCLVMGSEAHGISDDIMPLVDHLVAIPGAGSAESLNVAVAAGILLYQLTIDHKPSRSARP
ncbi:MAG: RNA methyltransferase [Candidatus Marinimicrobia bacterium]|nr:RNA methyltransferase [Candidatus Neomarinimicrobiota bacterium]MDP6456793.1 RNA methyltransferase [Candidatus Neomarinimicrobiota bacterium]MDP6835895.1 RNA methyltransferase [Candidatus Neomarinimicrobiota bacterium]MDP6966729.1 RNA methyltransferase [Candidatus Neomarinimicrobiota bacterium]